MRIDKFLWCARLAKTRSLASEWADKEAVQLNGVAVKPSKSVKVGDTIGLRQLGIIRTYKVLSLPTSRVGAPKVPEFMLEVTSGEELEKMAFIQLVKRMHRSPGTGRPTKKDRRELDRLHED